MSGDLRLPHLTLARMINRTTAPSTHMTPQIMDRRERGFATPQLRQYEFSLYQSSSYHTSPQTSHFMMFARSSCAPDCLLRRNGHHNVKQCACREYCPLGKPPPLATG